MLREMPGYKRRLRSLRALRVVGSMVLLGSAGVAQRENAAAFDVASVKPSERQVGPDYNNRLTFAPAGLSGKNVTLRRLVAEAYRLQMRQVIGPNWLDQNEYDVEARAGHPAGKDEMDVMLRELLARRFDLKQHRETREMRLYELVADGAGPKIQPIKDGETAKAGGGLRFHGEMRQFADFLAVQFSISAADNPSQPAIAGGPTVPVIDKTGLTGTYDFSVGIRPELGVDKFTQWQRVLPEQLGLRLETRRGQVEVIVIDSAARIPTAN
jgi:uncharacterized protein (TIGR03435 family)